MDGDAWVQVRDVVAVLTDDTQYEEWLWTLPTYSRSTPAPASMREQLARYVSDSLAPIPRRPSHEP